MIEVTGLIGRDNELQCLNQEMLLGSNIIIIAPLGWGKNVLYEYLQELANEYGYFNIEGPDDTFSKVIKALVQNYCQKYPMEFYLSPSDFKRMPKFTQKKFQQLGYFEWGTLSRFFGHDMGIGGTIERIQYSLYWMLQKSEQYNNRKPIIFLKSLRRVTDGNSSLFIKFFYQCQIITVLDKQYVHLKHMQRLLNNFQYVLELEPLTIDSCCQIVQKWLLSLPLSFESIKAKTLFIEHVARDSCGQPAIILRLLKQAQKEPEITKDKIREFEWAKVEYMSMYPLLMIILALLTVFRTLGRSIGDTTWLIVGAVSGVVLIILFFLRSVLDKE